MNKQDLRKYVKNLGFDPDEIEKQMLLAELKTEKFIKKNPDIDFNFTK